MSNRGFAVLPTLIVLAVIAYIGVVVFEKTTNTANERESTNENTNLRIDANAANDNANNANEEVYCIADSKLCPDGSYVGRVPPNCEFAACPTANTTNGSESTNTNRNANDVVCAQDVAYCPGGTIVQRIPPSCEFAACPPNTSTPRTPY